MYVYIVIIIVRDDSYVVCMFTFVIIIVRDDSYVVCMNVCYNYCKR